MTTVAQSKEYLQDFTHAERRERQEFLQKYYEFFPEEKPPQKQYYNGLTQIERKLFIYIHETLKRERQREQKNKIARKNYQQNLKYQEQQKKQARERYLQDPEVIELKRERERERKRKRRQDPEYREREREQGRKRWQDPEYREQQRERQRERQRKQRQDPEYREQQREYQQEYQQEYRQKFKLGKEILKKEGIRNPSAGMAVRTYEALRATHILLQENAT